MDIEQVLASKQCVFSVIGPHAGEDMAAIYGRKAKDINALGYSFWLVKCSGDIYSKIRELGTRGELSVVFLFPSQAGGARPATTETPAKGYMDGANYHVFDSRLSPVTGMISRSASCLVLDELNFFEEEAAAPVIDLWDYLEALKNTPVRFRLGQSTIPCIKSGMSMSMGMKSHIRKISAIGHLKAPYAVRPVTG